MKKRLIIIGSILLAVILALSGVIVLTTGAEEGEPSVCIAAQNLAFKDSVYLVYAVKTDNVPAGAEKGMLLWLNPQESYTIDNAEINLTDSKTERITLNDVEGTYDVYEYHGLASRQMADTVYAVAYIKNGDSEYYSAPLKYSVLQYVYNKTGKTGSRTNVENLPELLEQMLDYGAAAQTYAVYKADRLANDDWYQVLVNGGTVEDGFNYGLYLTDDEVTLAAPAEKDGQAFSYWKTGAGDVAGTAAVSTITVGTANETYTAVYGEAVPTDRPVPSEGLEYKSNGDGTCYVSGIGTCQDTDIVIPPVSPAGDKVTSIGSYAFYNCTGLTSITIPDSVTSIGSYAFYNCTGLTSITIPDSVKSIGSGAFSGCTGLTSITIPDSVTYIGDAAFYNCSGLTSITIPEGVTSIGNDAFWGCTGLMNITIPDSVTSIGEYAFNLVANVIYNGIASGAPWGARALNGYLENNLVYRDASKKELLACPSSVTGTITIPDSVTSIGDYAFSQCTGLTSVIIPDSVTSIGQNAFRNCTGLTSVTIPDSVTSIGSYAFSGCTGLTSVIIPDSMTYISDYVFIDCTGLTSVTIPDSVKSIGGYAFSGCTGLTSITIPDSVKSIVYGAFSGCTGLTSITIPDSVTSIGYGAFSGCTGLTSITIPDSVTSIGSYAFYNCTGLTSITIPDSVTSIGSYAFYNCTGLTSITIGNGVTSIGSYAFYSCTNLTIYCEADSKPSGWSSSWNPDNRPVVWGWVDPNATHTVTFIADGETVAVKEYTIAAPSIEVPEVPAKAGYSGAWEAYSLDGSDIVVNAVYTFAVQYSEGLAFTSNRDGTCKVSGIGTCQDTDIVIPLTSLAGDKVTSIGSYAFEGCTGLTSITIPQSVTSIGNYAFYGCDNLTIYCEAAEKPSGWDSDWNKSNCPVIWGYTGS